MTLSFTHDESLSILGTSSAGPPEEYTARLDVEIDSARQGWNFQLCTFFEINFPFYVAYLCAYLTTAKLIFTCATLSFY